MKTSFSFVGLLISQIAWSGSGTEINPKYDSTFAIYKRTQTYGYSRLHGYLTFGSPFELKQTTGWNEIKNLYPKNGFYSPFTINFAPTENVKPGIGLDVNLSNRFKIGMAVLPTLVFEYKGGKGTQELQTGFLFFYTTWRRGVWMNQSVKNSMFNINASYVLVPFKRLKPFGFELSLRTGLIFNKWTASTTLGAFDYTSSQGGTFGSTIYSDQTEASKTFLEDNSGIGFNASIDVSVYFGKHFSLFTQLMAGYTEEMSLSEKKVSSGTQTAYLPSQTMTCNGVGFTIGFAFHFIHKPLVKKEPVNGGQSFPW